MRAHVSTTAPMPDAGPVRASVWTIQGHLERSTYLVIAVLGFSLSLAGWWLLAASGWFDKIFLPAPMDVLWRALLWLREDGLLGDTAVSMYRVTAGFMLAAVMAVPLGVFVGTLRPVQAFFEPLMEFARYLPAVAFVPLVLLWVGIGEGSKIAIIWIGTFFQMVLMTADDVRRVPAAQIEVARTMGARQGEILSRVVLKSAWPAIVDTLRITMGWAWTYLVVAELVAANSGLGYAILKAQRFLQTDKIFVGILAIGIIGLAMDQLFRLIHRCAFPYLHRGAA